MRYLHQRPLLARDLLTIRVMIGQWCRRHHGRRMCHECWALYRYARSRLVHCPYGSGKPACRHCPRHCYAPRMRQRMRQVMQAQGRWLLLTHPLLALVHLRRARRGPP